MSLRVETENRLDDHHVFHHRRYWEAYEPGKLVRRAVIARGMTRAAHNLLHIECPSVPPLSYESISGVAKRMDKRYDNVFKGIDAFCLATEEVNTGKHIRPGEIALNELAIESLRLQIPYIRYGISDKKTAQLARI